MPTYTSEGIIGWRAQLLRGGTLNTDPYTALPELITFTPASPENEQIDFTHLDSPQRRREFKPGFSDGGTVEFEMNARFQGGALDVTQRAILNDKVTGTTRYWQIRIYTNEDASPTLLQTIEFQGNVQSASLGPVSLTDPQKISGSIKCTGGETWTPPLT
jgi:hypothetical protein